MPKRDVPVMAFFTWQAPPPMKALRRMPCRAIHGDILGDRVLAEAVGRRGPFLKRRFFPQCEQCWLLRKCTERG